MSTCPDCGKPKATEPGVRWEPDTYCKAEFPEGSLAGCYSDTIALLRSKLSTAEAKLVEAERELKSWRALGEMYVIACDRGVLDTKAARDQFAALLGIGPGGMRNKEGG